MVSCLKSIYSGISPVLQINLKHRMNNAKTSFSDGKGALCWLPKQKCSISSSIAGDLAALEVVYAAVVRNDRQLWYPVVQWHIGM